MRNQSLPTTTTQLHQAQSALSTPIPEFSRKPMSSTFPTSHSDQNPEQLQVTPRGRIILKPLHYC